jgi:PAS domain S-box-containing protein
VADRASYTVLLTGLDQAVRSLPEALRDDPTASVTAMVVDEERLAGDDYPPGDVIVIGPSAGRPHAAAERLRRRAPTAQVVFLLKGRDLEKFRATLPFVPQLSDAWTAAAADPIPKTAALIFEAARASRHLKTATQVRDRINAQIALRLPNGEMERRQRHILLSERYMATVLQQAPDPIFALDLDGNILSLNDAASHVFELRQNTAEGRPAIDLFHPQARADAAEKLAEARTGGVITRWLTFMSNRYGAMRDASVSLAPVRDSDDNIVSLAMITRDITDFKQVQRSLQERSAELEATVAQRDLLLREVYHRVKNNLQVVDTLVALKARRIKDADMKEWLGQLRQRVYTIGLVHQQLMSSDDLQTIELAQFFRDLAENIGQPLDEGDRLDADVGQSRVKLGLEVAVPLGLIVTELLSNAVKHGRPHHGPARIALRFHRDGDRGVVTIHDNGDSPEGHHRLGGNSGSGGNIIMGLVKQIDGQLRSSFNGGTQVIVEFPIMGKSR